jgi:hypothetical protein
MSRLRRLELHSRYFFITCNLRRDVRPLDATELDTMADTLSCVRSTGGAISATRTGH